MLLIAPKLLLFDFYLKSISTKTILLVSFFLNKIKCPLLYEVVTLNLQALNILFVRMCKSELSLKISIVSLEENFKNFSTISFL